MAEGTKLATNAEVALSELLPSPDDLRLFSTLLKKVVAISDEDNPESLLTDTEKAWLESFMARLQAYTESRLVVSFDFWLVVLPSLIKAAEDGQREAMRKRGRWLGAKKEKSSA